MFQGSSTIIYNTNLNPHNTVDKNMQISNDLSNFSFHIRHIVILRPLDFTVNYE